MDQTNQTQTAYICGLPNSAAKAFFVCKRYAAAGKNAVFISREDTESFDSAVLEFTANTPASFIPLPEQPVGRMGALYQLLTAKPPFIISLDYETLAVPLPDPDEFKRRVFTVHRGDTLRRADLLDILENNGYSREEYTEYQGQYAVRGSVVDIFCLNRDLPLRLYFAGNRVDMISAFDIDTQNTKERVEEAVVIPIKFENETASLADYAPNAAYVFDEPGPDTNVSAYPTPAVITLLPNHRRKLGFKSQPQF